MAEPDPEMPETPQADGRFPIVGVGASAGGLEPIGVLLRALPVDAELAVVVVMHLDPTHESGLAAIFSRTTTMAVEVAVDGARVEAGHVYVIPPNANLFLRAGRLQLTPRTEEAGHYLPIDAFFRSLAEDAPGRSFGVVLSGSGSDGALGIQAIRAAGGVTFAQDGSAAHGAMPQAAVATGCVDFVLAPDAITREILRVRPLLGVDGAPHPGDEALLQEVFALVRAAGGADFSSYKRSSALRRVRRRVQITRQGTLSAYVDFLRVDPAEATTLAEDVLIHVTSFFRDPMAFDALKRLVFARLVERRSGNAPLRVWVPGCSTGEEVYSIAIGLLEHLAEAGASLPVQLFGTDVSAAAIERARAGRYLENIAADVSSERLQRFFVKSDGGYQIRRDVRDLCVFARHDVTRDPAFSSMDLVSCRNLLIYLDPPLQQRVFQVFHYALKADGFLFLGRSESVGTFGGFAVVGSRERIFARTGPPTRVLSDQRPWADYVHGTIPPSPPLNHASIHREADRVVVKAHGSPGAVVADDRTVVLFRGDAGPYLAPTPGAASLDVLRLVRADLRFVLRQCLDAAARSGTVARAPASCVDESGTREVEVEVIPFEVPPSQQKLFVVLFREITAVGAAAVKPGQIASATDEQLRQELASSREYLQSVIAQLESNNEELGVANEEAVSHNEELHSTNEEFQLAKEELQASNEELATVNGELTERNAEATRLNDDLMNLFAGVAIPIVILGPDGRIRRFTPAAGQVLGLIATDLGRPFTDLRARLQTSPPAPALSQVIAEVQSSLSSQEHAVRDEGGRWYQLAVRPYLTALQRVDGVTITLFDLDAIKRDEWAREAEYQSTLQRALFDALVAGERERRRIATDLHDRIGQSLAFLQIKLTSIGEGLGGAPGDALRDCVELVASSVEETRTLTFELSPPVLYDLGLDAAVSWMAERFAARHGLAVDVAGEGAGRLHEDVAAVLFRSIRELLTNVTRHARCDRAKVILDRARGSVVIRVEDAGVGIDQPSGSRHLSGFGLFSVREQISRLGGVVEIDSSIGAGTRVTLRVPVGSAP